MFRGRLHCLAGVEEKIVVCGGCRGEETARSQYRVSSGIQSRRPDPRAPTWFGCRIILDTSWDSIPSRPSSLPLLPSVFACVPFCLLASPPPFPACHTPLVNTRARGNCVRLALRRVCVCVFCCFFVFFFFVFVRLFLFYSAPVLQLDEDEDVGHPGRDPDDVWCGPEGDERRVLQGEP